MFSDFPLRKSWKTLQSRIFSALSDWMNIRFCPAMLYAGLPSEPMGSRIEDRTHHTCKAAGRKWGDSESRNMISNSIWIFLGIFLVNYWDIWYMIDESRLMDVFWENHVTLTDCWQIEWQGLNWRWYGWDSLVWVSIHSVADNMPCISLPYRGRTSLSWGPRKPAKPANTCYLKPMQW